MEARLTQCPAPERVWILCLLDRTEEAITEGQKLLDASSDRLHPLPLLATRPGIPTAILLARGREATGRSPATGPYPATGSTGPSSDRPPAVRRSTLPRSGPGIRMGPRPLPQHRATRTPRPGLPTSPGQSTCTQPQTGTIRAAAASEPLTLVQGNETNGQTVHTPWHDRRVNDHGRSALPADYASQGYPERFSEFSSSSITRARR